MNVIKTLIFTMASLFTCVIKEVRKCCPQRIAALFSTYSHRPNLGPIRAELEKFEGGSVDLEMDEDSGIALLTLNNPTRLNSMTGRMMVDLADRITQLEQWKAGKGLILMGANGNFCSGGDLTFVRKALHFGSEMAAYQHDTLTRLHNLPLISTALIQGHTLGGGAELTTACDFRAMAPSAKIGFVQIKMGLTTGWGATTRLIHRLGRHKTLGLLTSAKVMTAEEAHGEGLVDLVLSQSSSLDDELAECKRWLLSTYLKHSPDLIQAVKKSVVFSDLNRDMETSLRNEREVFAKYWGGPAQKAALDSHIKHK